MILKTRVKGGIILYALLLMSLFSLLLQFYLNRQLSLIQTNQASRDSLIAYSMAIWTRDKFYEEEEKMEEKAANLVNEKTLENKQNQIVSEETFERELEVSGETSKEEEAEALESKREDIGQSLGQQPFQGEISFDQGQVYYQLEENKLEVKVHLLSGQNFVYVFHINGKKA